MWLLNTTTLKLEEFVSSTVPKYAILSHTWALGHEISFQEMQASPPTMKSGYRKIQNCCEQALADGLSYAWVDTCCIDKKSSAELTESINSMFRWYSKAEICYGYLADIADPLDKTAFVKSQWFTRGWTLQELLAPRHMRFYTVDWIPIGRRSKLLDLVEEATGINKTVFQGARLYHGFNILEASVAQKMSWISNRKTTREEDMAYCLLGIFDVGMTLLYGEGGREAFRRLQEEIIKTSNDLSIFAWIQPTRTGPLCLSALAESPSQFTNCSDIPIIPTHPTSPTVLTNETIKARLELCFFDKRLHGVLGGSSETDAHVYAIPLVEVSPMTYFRSSGQTVVMHRQAKRSEDVSLVNRVKKHLSTVSMSPVTYNLFAIEHLPPGYVLSEITPFKPAEAMQPGWPGIMRYDTLIGTPIEAHGPTWVEIHHPKRNWYFVFPVYRHFLANDPRQQLSISRSSSRGSRLSLEARGVQQEDQPIFEQERGEILIRVTASSRSVKSFESSPRYRPSRQHGDVLVLKVTAHEPFGVAVQNGVAAVLSYLSQPILSAVQPVFRPLALLLFISSTLYVNISHRAGTLKRLPTSYVKILRGLGAVVSFHAGYVIMAIQLLRFLGAFVLFFVGCVVVLVKRHFV